LLPASTARNAKRQYLSNAEADFEVIRTARGDRVKLAIGCKKVQPEMEICNQK